MQKGKDFVGVSVVYFCHDGQGQFLLAKRSRNARDEHGRWDTGGGALEFGDTVNETLIKEIKEEYCTEVLEQEFLGFREIQRLHDGQPTHWIVLDFKVRVEHSLVKNGEPHKFEELGWFTFENLPEPLHSQVPVLFEKYRDKLR